MELITGIFIALIWICMMPILRIVTTFFHEMGHAIPALVFTDDKVEVFVGSYGDREKSFNFNLGRLFLYMRMQVFDWRIGMCITQGSSSWMGRLWILLGGPFASIMICGSVLIYLSTSAYPDYVLVISIALFLLAVVDLLVNLVPAATSYRSSDGTIQLSDGRQIQELFATKGLSEEYFKLEQQFYKKEYDKVIQVLKSKIQVEELPKNYYTLLIKAYQKTKAHKNVIETYERMVDHYPLIIDDYRTIGLSYLGIKNYTECIRCLNEYLFANYTDFEANCARGVARMNLGDKIEAIRDFEASISYSKHKNVSIPLSHKGYLMILLDDIENGYQNLLAAEKYDIGGSNDFLPYYFATYFEKVGNYSKALHYYNVAKNQGFDFYGLEYKIYEMEELIKKQK